MKRILVIAAFTVVGFGCSDEEKNNESNNNEGGTVSVADCNAACVKKAEDCESTVDMTESCAKNICYEEINDGSLTCLGTATCQSFLGAVGSAMAICGIPAPTN